MMKKQSGFTLIELMIVVAIVAILAGIAWPSYQEHVRSSNRADAQGALLGLAQAMERHFTERGSYLGAADANDAPTIFPTQSPIDGNNKTYNLRVVVPSAGTTYTLLAQPIAGTVQATDGNLQLSSSGEKAWDRDNNGSFDNPGDLCWNRSCN